MRPAVALSRIFARLHRWYAAAWFLSRQLLSTLDSDSVGRLQYALMMAHRTSSGTVHKLLSRIIERNRHITPALRIELAAMATGIGDVPLSNSLLEEAARQAEDVHVSDVARSLIDVNMGFANGTLQQAISAQVGALGLAPDPAVVTLVPLSSRYLELWQLWLQQVRKHIGGPVIVLVMDDAALAATADESGVYGVDLRESFSWNAYGFLHPRSRGVLWLLRVLLLRELVRRGHATLVLDLDAIAISDLAPMLASLPAADVVAQKDHSLPMDVNRQHGFVLCCGFMVWRPSLATVALLDRFAAETAIERDDQMALNHLLARTGLRDRTEDAGSIRFESVGVRFVCPSPSLVSRTLYSGTVIRHFQQEGQSIAELRATLGLR